MPSSVYFYAITIQFKQRNGALAYSTCTGRVQEPCAHCRFEQIRTFAAQRIDRKPEEVIVMMYRCEFGSCAMH